MILENELIPEGINDEFVEYLCSIGMKNVINGSRPLKIGAGMRNEQCYDKNIENKK